MAAAFWTVHQDLVTTHPTHHPPPHPQIPVGRYMPQGLQWILRDFHHVTVRGEAGTVPSIFLVINVYLQVLSGPWPWLGALIRWTIYPLNNVAGLLAGKVYRGDQFASNYFVAAVR